MQEKSLSTWVLSLGTDNKFYKWPILQIAQFSMSWDCFFDEN